MHYEPLFSFCVTVMECMISVFENDAAHNDLRNVWGIAKSKIVNEWMFKILK